MTFPALEITIVKLADFSRLSVTVEALRIWLMNKRKRVAFRRRLFVWIKRVEVSEFPNTQLPSSE